MKSSLFCLIAFAATFQFGYGASILGLYPWPAISHQFVFRNLMLELHKRGHEVVVLTPNPINDPTLKNYTEIDVSYLYGGMNDLVKNSLNIRAKKPEWWERFKVYLGLVGRQVEEIYKDSTFQAFYKGETKPKFDLVMFELLHFVGLDPLMARFDAPLIGITSLGLTTTNHFSMGNPILPSHPSNWELGNKVGVNLPFWRRMRNFIETWRFLYYFYNEFVPSQHEIARKYLGDDIPYAGDVSKNISMVFVNQQAAISFARPQVPNVIHFGGFHVSKNAAPLPKELKDFLDGATQGFIYMSLGSNVKSNMLANETRQVFIDVFSKLPCRVLWKFENDVMPGKPDNVYISKWVPQQAVLAHPNIKLFVYQGGLQSTEEALSHGVPLVGIPVFADQDHQVQKMVSVGVARDVEVIGITREKFDEAIRDVLRNKRYKEKMLELKSLIHDRPYDPMENAIWWIEFVIRHRGAPHLRSSIIDEPWYTRSDMDIVAFLSVSALLAAILSLVAAKKFISFAINFYYAQSSNEKHKIN